MKVLKIVAVIYFILILTLLSRTMERQNCISSTIVKAVDILREGNPVEIPNCYESKKASGTFVLNDFALLQNVQMQVAIFEESLKRQLLFIPYKKITIQIQEAPGWEVSKNKIILGRDAVREGWNVRYALLRAWIMNWGSDGIKNDKFLQVLVADIYSYLFWGKKDSERYEIKDNWIGNIYSEKDICSSENRPWDQFNFCHLLPKIQQENFKNISIWSLRPFVMNYFYNHYQEMSLKEKVKEVDRLTKVVAQMSWYEEYVDLDIVRLNNIYNRVIEKVLGRHTTQTSFQIESIIENQEEAPIGWDVGFGKNILIKKIRNEFLNPINQSSLSIQNVTSLKWYLYSEQVPTLKELSRLPAQKVVVIIQKQRPIEVHVPSLKLLVAFHYPQLLDLDVQQAQKNSRLSEILGWNPIQVH